ncbi:MAG: imidazole glycerol phosphate synthase subunit HisF [Clostridia bacterium]|nr:imidazole glycerol phosphate synthase subunit HisF [Clostridia bacterium]
MQAKRIIPCLDVASGRVVKGTKFINLRDAGDPVELAAYYDGEGADELVFLDITASYEKRKTMVDLVRRTAENISIPFIIGGGIKSLEDIAEMFEAGADKVSISTAAVENPELIGKAAKMYGTQRIVVAIDAKKTGPDSWEVYTHGGRKAAGLDALEWAKKVEELGAGEILLTSIDKDGTKDGYDIELTAAVSEAVNIPVIASGGAGSLKHILEALTKGKADAALAASIFHYGQDTIKEAKDYLRKHGVVVRQ